MFIFSRGLSKLECSLLMNGLVLDSSEVISYVLNRFRSNFDHTKLLSFYLKDAIFFQFF